jgi:hypothetical protein
MFDGTGSGRILEKANAGEQSDAGQQMREARL